MRWMTHHAVTEADGHGGLRVPEHRAGVEAALRLKTQLLQLGRVLPYVRNLYKTTSSYESGSHNTIQVL